MDINNLWALLIGLGTGLFLALTSAWILKRAFKLMDSPEVNDGKDTNISWSLGQAMGLASLWVSKFIGACLLLYLCQKWGYSIKWLGSGIPLGVIIGVMINRSREN